MSYQLNPVQVGATSGWDSVNCLKGGGGGGQPDFNLYAYVRYVGIQYLDYWSPYTRTPATGWLPLRTETGETIDYSIGGINYFNEYTPYGAGSFYLGPWVSSIDIWSIKKPTPHDHAGFMTFMSLWRRTWYTNPVTEQQVVLKLEPIEYSHSNGAGVVAGAFYVSYGFEETFARSRGQWEFANSNYEVIATWAGYSRLRTK